MQYGQTEKCRAFDSWMYKVAYRSVIKYAKSNHRHEHLSLLENQLQTDGQLYSGETPEDEFYSMDILKGMKNQDKTLLYLRVAEEMDFAEVASIIGISASTARKRYQRLRDRLKSERTPLEVSNDR